MQGQMLCKLTNEKMTSIGSWMKAINNKSHDWDK
jgi:hypothetical protein